MFSFSSFCPFSLDKWAPLQHGCWGHAHLPMAPANGNWVAVGPWQHVLCWCFQLFVSLLGHSPGHHPLTTSLSLASIYSPSTVGLAPNDEVQFFSLFFSFSDLFYSFLFL